MLAIVQVKELEYQLNKVLFIKNIYFIYMIFFTRGYCSNLEPRKYSSTIKGKDQIYYGQEFNTYTFSSLVWVYESFYKNGKKKKMPLNLEKFFTPLTLAILISDDGGFVGSGVRNRL